HGKTVPVPQIEDPMLTRSRAVEREQVRTSEVMDMDVVADCSSVWCRIVGSVDLNDRIDPESRPKDVWDQVGLWLVVLSRAIARTGDVEVAQADRPEAVSRAEVSDHEVHR